jgi:tyrosine-protein kinase Etk/Wzc
MTPPPELLGGMKRLPLIGPVLARNGLRRALFGVALALCAALTLFPQQYRTAVTLTPSDPSTLGLQGALGQLGAFNTVFGNQAAIEIALKVARSRIVRDNVISRLDLVKALKLSDELETSRFLAGKVDIRTLRGGIIQIEIKLADADLGRRVVGAFADATREELSQIGKRQTRYKRAVLEKLTNEATERYQTALSNYNRYRLTNRTAEPNFSLASVGNRVELLKSVIKTKEVLLQSLMQFATNENFQIKQVRAEMSALQSQLREAESQQPRNNETIGSVVAAGRQLTILERELAISRSLYDSYTRFLEGTYVEDLTSTANVRILETPYVDSARQYNPVGLAFGVLLLLLALAFEMQALRRPVGMA